jgi:hypothetical protein
MLLYDPAQHLGWHGRVFTVAGGVGGSRARGAAVWALPAFRAVRAAGSRPHLALILQQARKARIFTPVRETSGESRLRAHVNRVSGEQDGDLMRGRVVVASNC